MWKVNKVGLMRTNAPVVNNLFDFFEKGGLQ
jgi:hypothetical protein